MTNEVKKTRKAITTGSSNALVTECYNTCFVIEDAIKDFFSSLWEGIKSIFTTVVNVISMFLANAWNTS